MKIELNSDQINEIAKLRIKELEKEVAKLRKTVTTQKRKLEDLSNGMDITKERRSKIRTLAEGLASELSGANWTDYDD